MDTGLVLLILFVAIVVVSALMMTGIRIIRPDEIGFIYRRGRFLRLVQPGLIIAIPIILKVRRMKTESLNIVVESSANRAELQLGIADPSRVPVTAEEIGSEAGNRASELLTKALSRYSSGNDHLDAAAAAKEIENRLDTPLRDIGLKVVDLRIERLP